MDDVASCLGDPSLETTQHISSNHMDMCRFSGSEDAEYRKVAAALDHIHTRITSLPGLCPTFVPKTGSPLSESHRQALIDSLWHHTIDTRYATIKSAHARTCEWLLKKTEYQDWLDINKTENHHGVLWIKGKPGSGKSTLVKFAVANARKTRAETAVISFFFNARGEDLEKSTLGMYRSLLYQILNTFPYLQTVLDSLRPTVPREGETYRWEKDDLQNLFATAVENLGQRRLMCFIDALNECEEDQIRDLVAFLEHLGRLATSSRIHFYVCLSSRHYPHISIENGIEMKLEDQEDHAHDITKYLNGTLRSGRGKQSQQIKAELLRRASGVFFWVVLVVQILNKEYDHGRIHDLRKRLGELPDGLEKLLEEILTRDQGNMEELILCLQWILYTKYPLRQEEVYYAILSGTDPELLTSSTSEEITTQDMERFILSCSKGLAETTRLKARTVEFIHESVREFLLGKNGFSKLRLELGRGLSHDRLKQCCYNSVMIDTSAFLPSDMELPAASSEKAKGLRESISQKWPFLKYAVRNVLYHADVADGQGVSQRAFVKNFALSKWILLDNLFEKFQIRRHTSGASLLYILTKRNLSNLIRIQLELCQHELEQDDFQQADAFEKEVRLDAEAEHGNKYEEDNLENSRGSQHDNDGILPDAENGNNDDLASLLSIQSFADSGYESLNDATLRDEADELTLLLLDDDQLQKLFTIIFRRSKAQVQFVSKFRMLLRVFGTELRREAQDASHEAAAELARLRATYIASEIQKRYMTEKAIDETSNGKKSARVAASLLKHLEFPQPYLYPDVTDQYENASDSEASDDIDGAIDEYTTPAQLSKVSLEKVKEFMTCSQAFANLQNALRRMVYPNPLNAINDQVSNAHKLYPGKVSAIFDVHLDIDNYLSSELNYQTSLQERSDLLGSVLIISGTASSAFATTAANYMRWKWPQLDFGLLETIECSAKARRSSKLT